MKTPTPPQDTPDLHTIAYEAHQQAARARAIVHALAEAAGDDSDWRLCLEAVELLLNPVCDHISDLDWELHPGEEHDRCQPPQAQEVHP